MSDNFDPDAWPHASNGGTPSRGAAPQPGTRPRQDDDWNSSTFDDDWGDASTFRSEPGGSTARTGQDEWGSSAEDYGFPDEPADRTRRNDRTSDDYGFAQDGYDDYDDERGYDDYDYQDFDDDPGKGGGGRKIVGALAIVLLVAAVAFAISQFAGGGKGGGTAGRSSTSAPGGGIGDDGSGTTVTIPSDVQSGLQAAMDAWGQFIIDGDLNKVRPYFVNDGRQFQNFETEAASIAAKGYAGPAEHFDVAVREAVNTDENTWLLRTQTTMSRPGETPQIFPYEIRITRGGKGQPWQIDNVRQMT